MPAGASYLATDEQGGEQCPTPAAGALLALSGNLRQGRLALEPTLVSFHQASLDHAVWLLAPSQNNTETGLHPGTQASLSHPHIRHPRSILDPSLREETT